MIKELQEMAQFSAEACKIMKPKDERRSQGSLFDRELEGMVKESHPLVKLSKSIDSKRFEEKFGKHFSIFVHTAILNH
jgi:hypothetical protein